MFQTRLVSCVKSSFFVQMAEMEATGYGWRHVQEYLATEGHRRALNRRNPLLLRKAALTIQR